MAISINPSTKVISVPKADLMLIQTVPTEIRELDSNLFRHWLDDWMDSEQGIYMPKTHVHATEVLIDGLAYARTIEILAPYTVTFEDGQYQINIVGSNNNIHSRRNLNQVSIVPNNSAGLVNVRASEVGSFVGVVALDVANGVTGTTYPTGTHAQPSNNVADTKLIAQLRGIETIVVHGSLTLDTGDDLSGYVLQGENAITTQITVNAGAVVTNTQFEDAILTGTLDGYAYVKHCAVHNLAGLEGYVELSMLSGALSMTGTQNLYFVDCKSGCVGLGTSDLPVLSMAGSGRHVAFRNYAGPIKITNSTDAANTLCVDVASGATITLDASCTAGTIYVRGIANIINNSAMTVSTAAQLDQASIGSAVATRALDGDITVEQALRVVMAALAGKRQGIGTATEQYFARDGVTPRITLTPDAAGNGLPVINGAI